MWDVRRIFLILFENLFKPRQLYLQPQSGALSDLWISFLVCFLIFIEYKSKKYVKKQPHLQLLLLFFLIACWSCTCATDVEAFLEIEAKG